MVSPEASAMLTALRNKKKMAILHSSFSIETHKLLFFNLAQKSFPQSNVQHVTLRRHDTNTIHAGAKEIHIKITRCFYYLGNF